MSQNTPQPYRSVNPATGELLAEYPALTDAEANALLDRAYSAYLKWSATPLDERIALFRRLADLIEAEADRIAADVSREMGKLFDTSGLEVSTAPAMLRLYADNAKEWLADEEVETTGFKRLFVRRKSMGVTLAIEPWNAPIYQAMRAAVPNLILGNTVLMKPARNTAGATLNLDRLFAEAGFPADVYTTALISHGQVSEYMADTRVRAVTLTGSTAAGRTIGELAGKHVKPAVLELGGSDPMIVLDSADPTFAAGFAATCRLVIGGQVCISPKRVIVTEKNAEAFTSAYVETFAGQTLGDPFDASTTLGPMSSAAAADELQDQYQDAVDKGAKVLVAGGRVEGEGAFFKPAVLTDITPEMRLATEEAFGPIGLLYVVPDEAAAIELANDSEYGLGGIVVGDEERGLEVADQVDTGTIGVNSWVFGPSEAPFGGTKNSGYGRELGRNGMDPFANIKTIGLG